MRQKEGTKIVSISLCSLKLFMSLTRSASHVSLSLRLKLLDKQIVFYQMTGDVFQVYVFAISW